MKRLGVLFMCLVSTSFFMTAENGWWDELRGSRKRQIKIGIAGCVGVGGGIIYATGLGRWILSHGRITSGGKVLWDGSYLSRNNKVDSRVQGNSPVSENKVDSQVQGNLPMPDGGTELDPLLWFNGIVF